MAISSRPAAPITAFTCSSIQPFMKVLWSPKLSAASAVWVAAIIASLMAYSLSLPESSRAFWPAGIALLAVWQ